MIGEHNNLGGNYMRKNFGAKPYLYPMPVLIIGTYDEAGVPNAMNAAWGGISEVNQISICVDDSHKTADNIIARGAFTVSVGTAAQMAACDFVGIVSGQEMPDKLLRTGWTIEKSEFVDAPIFAELPMALECKLISYTKETCTLIGEIVNVSIDESVLDEKETVAVQLLDPLVYDPVNSVYYKLGERAGNAFHEGIKLK